MKNLTWQNPEQLFVAQELINKVKSKCCGIKDDMAKVILPYILSLMLSLSATAQTKRALVIGLGQQEDKVWNKINGDKDVTYVLGYLKKFRRVIWSSK